MCDGNKLKSGKSMIVANEKWLIDKDGIYKSCKW